jgi:rare lipoprotein A
MALVTRNRLVPAFLAACLTLSATAAAQTGTGGSVAPEPTPTPALDTGTALLGHAGKVRGTVKRRFHGRVVRIQRFDATAGTWRAEGRGRVWRTGKFTARWRPGALGEQRIRAVVQGRRSARVTSASEAVTVQVFKGSMATWYGPGLYGNTTACGQKLTPDLVGVAHKSLPCGTMVQIAYNGRTVTVPVVDRGPYADGMTWDITAGAAKMLGFTSTDAVGAVVQSK